MNTRYCMAALVACLALLTPALRAQVPQLLNHQGRIAVGEVNFDGAGLFKFALVNGDGTVTHWSNDGTGVAGAEPVDAVSLVVVKGLYSVLLGDIALTNMTEVPASVFQNNDVWLRVWFDDGVHGSQQLAPDQRIAAAGFAMMAADVSDNAITETKLADGAVSGAKLAAGAVTGAHVAGASLDATHLIVPEAPVAGNVLGFDGASLVWQSGTGDSVFGLNGTSAFYDAGNVGIGTNIPAHRLSLAGGPFWTSNSWLGALEISNASAIGWALNTGGYGFGMGHTNGGFAMFRTTAAPGTAASPALYDLFIDDAGGVSIGTLTPNPGYRLSVNGGVQFTPGGSGGTMQFGTPNTETGMTWTNASTRADLRFDGSTMKLLAGPAGGPPSSLNGVTVNTSGNVGIGATFASAKLHVVGSGIGMLGEHSAGTGTEPGVFGATASLSANAVGVLGQVNSSSAGVDSAAVKGVNNSTGPGIGVWGAQLGSGVGVYGYTPSGDGVRGQGATGVAGFGSVGVFGSGAIGVRGNASGGGNRAVFGDGILGATGVYGSATGSGSAVKGVAVSGSAIAGEFVGLVTKSGGTFKIDHPLDPANKFLYHSFVESPDMMNIYNGNVTTDAKGEATVTMPEYFEALNRDFRYQLTVIGQFAQAIVGSKIKNRRFLIRTDKPNVEVSWQVTGVRQDAFAKANPIIVEVDKNADERGRYLTPAAFGQPEEKQIGRDPVPAVVVKGGGK